VSTFPWLTLAGAIPLAGSVAVALIPGPSAAGSPTGMQGRNLTVKWVALGFTVATLAVTAAMAAAFRPDGPEFQFTQVYRWIPQFGVYYAGRHRRDRAGPDRDDRGAHPAGRARLPARRLAVTAGAAVTPWLGIAPQPLIDLANQAANSLFVR
jgi:hypothetical protein